MSMWEESKAVHPGARVGFGSFEWPDKAFLGPHLSRNPYKVKHEPLGYLRAEGTLSANTLGQEGAGRVQRTAGRSLRAYSGGGGRICRPHIRGVGKAGWMILTDSWKQFLWLLGEQIVGAEGGRGSLVRRVEKPRSSKKRDWKGPGSCIKWWELILGGSEELVSLEGEWW